MWGQPAGPLIDMLNVEDRLSAAPPDRRELPPVDTLAESFGRDAVPVAYLRAGQHFRGWNRRKFEQCLDQLCDGNMETVLCT